MPVIFVGHGSPMNALEDNRWSRAFTTLGKGLPKPRAVLAVSAHWTTQGSWLTGNPRPRTIHDFGGFPDALFQMQYPAPGDPALAERIARVLGRDKEMLRTDWGLDHGSWTVLKHLLPNADVPVLQLSLDSGLSGAQHLELGRRLAGLRHEGVLLLGSGNIVHNLRDALARLQRGDTARVDWAERFDGDVLSALQQRDHGFLARAHESDAGRQAHPTAEHYLPLLTVAGAASDDDAVSCPVEGFDLGSVSMRSVRFG